MLLHAPIMKLIQSEIVYPVEFGAISAKIGRNTKSPVITSNADTTLCVKENIIANYGRRSPKIKFANCSGTPK